MDALAEKFREMHSATKAKDDDVESFTSMPESLVGGLAGGTSTNERL